MTRSGSRTTGLKRLAACGALLGLVAIGTTAAPKPAEAWWAHGGGWGGGYYHGGGWCCGVGIGLYVPPVVIAPHRGHRLLDRLLVRHVAPRATHPRLLDRLLEIGRAHV